MSSLLKKQVEEALQEILSPLGARLSGVSVTGADVQVVIDVDPARGNALEEMRQRAQEAAEKISGIGKVIVVLTAEKSTPPVIEKKKPVQITHKISSRPVAPKVRHMIAVASGKGGVGKSTVAANLAVAFRHLGKSVGLLDADIYGSSQPRMMGLRDRPEIGADDMIQPPVAHGIKVMSMGFFVEPEAPVIWRGPMVHSAIQQLLRDVDWGDLDILVIDLPPGTGDAQLSLAQYVPLSGAVIVSTPQDVALSEAKKGLRMFEKTNVDVLGIIENMSYHECTACGHREHVFNHGGARAAAADLGVDFLGEIPLLSAIREKADGGTPIVAADPKHPASEIFLNTASRIWMKLPAERPQKAAKA
jgi:ATP-binding protein involved in chromosome partitioning